jgi:predicted AlkP superfamily phosphohydrolase/phosphomutase
MTTLLIGVDGATFTVLQPFMDSGLMPNVRALVERGAHAPLRTIIPALTPPAWTSLMTGKRPGRHGVFDFFQKESPDSEYLRLSTSNDIGTPTIWTLASEHGRRVVSLNYPLMFPPPPVNGAVVPGGWMPWRQLRLGCHPPGLFDRLKRLPSFQPRELALDMELEAKAIEGCPDDEYVEWIQLHTRREERWLEILRYLVAEEESLDLVAVMFDGVDKLQHLCWRYIDVACRPAEPSAWEQQIIDLCEAYFHRLDEMIGEIVALGGPNATIVIGSDHGFGPTWDVFYLNRWLEDRGFLAWAAPDAATNGDGSLKVGFAHMARHIAELDWDRTWAYAATPSSQGIHIVRKTPGTDTPLPSEEYGRIREEIAAELRSVINPHTGRPLVQDVVTKEEAFAGPYDGIAPDLSLVLEDGAAISILRSDEVVRRRDHVNGHHRFHGVFIAAGPSIRAGQRLNEVSITDVAPLVLYSLDVPIPDDLDGSLPVEIFEPGALSRRAPRYESHDSQDTVLVLTEPIELDGDDEVLVLDRLRALGYVE